MDLQSLAELSDADLLARVKRLAQGECRATAALIAHLIEVENRKLYLAEACSSLFAYCIRVLHYSEPAAYNRIFAARAARTFPAVLSHLERGDIHLAAVRLLAPVLTTENHHELLAAAAHKSKREVEELVVLIRPQEEVRGSVRRLPPVSPVSPRVSAAHSPPAADAGGLAAPAAGSLFADPRPGAQPQAVPAESAAPDAVEGAAPDGMGNGVPVAAPLARGQSRPPGVQRATVAPLAPERYKIQFTAGAATRDNLRRAQEMLRHRVPDGDVGEVIGLALELLVRDLEKRKFAALAPRKATARAKATTTGTTTGRTTGATKARTTASAAATAAATRAATAVESRSRHIPAEVRRAVWQRDQGRCAFTAANGERCGEQSGLEFDHIRPHADGGGVERGNIRLLCRQHNQYEARQFFGAWHAAGEPVPRCG